MRACTRIFYVDVLLVFRLFPLVSDDVVLQCAFDNFGLRVGGCPARVFAKRSTPFGTVSSIECLRVENNTREGMDEGGRIPHFSPIRNMQRVGVIPCRKNNYCDVILPVSLPVRETAGRAVNSVLMRESQSCVPWESQNDCSREVVYWSRTTCPEPKICQKFAEFASIHLSSRLSMPQNLHKINRTGNAITPSNRSRAASQRTKVISLTTASKSLVQVSSVARARHLSSALLGNNVVYGEA